MRFNSSHRQEQRVDQRTTLRVDPKLVVSSRVLELQRFELEQAVEQELNDNPALERMETDQEEFDDASLIRQLVRERESAHSDDLERDHGKAYNQDDEADWVDFLPAPVSLRDHLLAQLSGMLAKSQRKLATTLVECVNERGYLTMPIEEIALVADADIDVVREAVRKLQTCDPPGVGAFDLRECLLLQLREENDDIARLAFAIVKYFWDDLLIKKTSTIARKYHVMPALVEKAFACVAAQTPYPGEAFETSSPAYRPPQLGSVVPDVVFRRTETGTTIEIRGCDPADFAINPWYREQYRKMKSDGARVASDEQKHVKEYVSRAVGFVQALHQRRMTMRKIARYLLTEQAGFVTTGRYQFLQPMTRVQLAKAIGMHESTVSRATMNKFVQIANGELVQFELFFKPALRVQKMIEEILLVENPNRPLSDREIADILKERGIEVARRTVNKYRERIRLLSSHQRRTA